LEAGKPEDILSLRKYDFNVIKMEEMGEKYNTCKSVNSQQILV
jgi:hypothetical protein